tara:strand:+ start:270 stop:704 length:435 start_codon:yes stop_codon:yes gene_type:complete
VTFDVLRLLEEEGYIKDGEDNLVHAEKAFFAARIMRWIRNKVQTEPDFDLQAYLTMLLYYKTDMADLSFSEDGDKILYRLKNPDREVEEIVNSLIKTTGKRDEYKEPTCEEEGTTTDSGAGTTTDSGAGTTTDATEVPGGDSNS